MHLRGISIAHQVGLQVKRTLARYCKQIKLAAVTRRHGNRDGDFRIIWYSRVKPNLEFRILF